MPGLVKINAISDMSLDDIPGIGVLTKLFPALDPMLQAPIAAYNFYKNSGGLSGLYAEATEYLPIASSIANRGSGTKRDYFEEDAIRKAQIEARWSVGAGSYLLYADDLTMSWHGTGTQAFNAIGGSGETQTNEKPYREIKFKTTLTPNDAILSTGWWKSTLRNSGLNPGALASDFFWHEIYSAIGSETARRYYKERAAYLRDLDDVPITVESSMFAYFPYAFMVTGEVNFQGGSGDAVYNCEIREGLNLVGTFDVTQNAWKIEPGAF